MFLSDKDIIDKDIIDKDVSDKDFLEELEQKKKEAERIILEYLPKISGRQQNVIDAMDYSVKAGGKRLRPIMMIESYRLFGGTEEVIKPFAAALEMIHTYSLVHDDLPAMDNDMLRRGVPTTHAKYGETMGILAGDALLNYAFETAAKAFSMTAEPLRAARALEILGKKAGIYGMLGGQVIDVEAEGHTDIDLQTILEIHTLKTAAMIESAMMIGAVLAGADETQVDIMEKVARNVGIAFQIQDDILDVTGSIEQLGKPIGSDARNQKITYVTLQGLEQSQEEVKRLSDEAISLLWELELNTEFMEELVRELTIRQK